MKRIILSSMLFLSFNAQAAELWCDTDIEDDDAYTLHYDEKTRIVYDISSSHCIDAECKPYSLKPVYQSRYGKFPFTKYVTKSHIFSLESRSGKGNLCIKGELIILSPNGSPEFTKLSCWSKDIPSRSCYEEAAQQVR